MLFRSLRPLGAVLALDGLEQTTTHQLLRTIATVCNRKARLLPMPLALVGVAAAACDAFARLTGREFFFNRDKVRELRAVGWVADGRPAQRALGIEPQVQLVEGLLAVAQREGLVRAAR